MTDKELLAIATEFDLGPAPILNGYFDWHKKGFPDHRWEHVFVKNRGNEPGKPDQWAIMFSERMCLNKNGRHEYEAMPSSRTDAFYKRARFDSVQEAIDYYQKWKEYLTIQAEKKLEKNASHIFNYEDLPALTFKKATGAK